PVQCKARALPVGPNFVGAGQASRLSHVFGSVEKNGLAYGQPISLSRAWLVRLVAVVPFFLARALVAFLTLAIVALPAAVKMIVWPVHLWTAILDAAIILTAVLEPAIFRTWILTTVVTARVGFGTSATIVFWACAAIHVPAIGIVWTRYLPVHGTVVAVFMSAILWTICRTVFRSTIRTALSGRNHIPAMKICRARSSCDRGTSMVVRGPQLAVPSGRVFVLGLHASCFKMAFAACRLFCMTRARHDSTMATVVADAVHRYVIDDRLV